MKIWLVQMNAKHEDKHHNILKIHNYIDDASDRQVDLIVFPELALTGYITGSKLRELGEPIPGPSTEGILERAKGNKMYVIMGMPEIRDGFIYNSAPLFGPDGLIGIYRKHYLPNFVSLAGFKYEEARDFKAALDLRIFDTRFGKIGIEICYDVWHPEMARAHALQGAWLIINISAARVGLAEWFQLIGRARALENIAWVAFVNQVGLQGGIPFGGGSCIVDSLSNVRKQGSIGEGAAEEIIECEADGESIAKQRVHLGILQDVRPEVLKRVYEIGASING